MALHWNPNGTGRDSYIQSNNGGFTIYHQGSGFDKPGTMRSTFVTRSPMKNVGALQKQKPYHYVTNGTGRDTYIHFNHGGFLSPTASPTQFFKTLRQPDHGMARSNSNQSFGSSGSLGKSQDQFLSTQNIIVNKKDIKMLLERKSSQDKLT